MLDFFTNNLITISIINIITFLISVIGFFYTIKSYYFVDDSKIIRDQKPSGTYQTKIKKINYIKCFLEYLKYIEKGDYIPGAPVNDEARKRNGNLPGQGGIFNYVNMHVYHYAGNNPVKYVDPDGKWINNENGTFTAEKGDTLHGLQQETGRDWTSSDYQGDPRKLQIGQTVSFAANNENNNNRTIDSISDAMNHYRTGNGAPVNIGPNTIETLRTHPDQLMRQNRIISGETTSPFEGNYNINMTANAFFIGQTRVEYTATYGSKFAVIDFTAFAQDGFWDARDVFNISNRGDGLGPRNERAYK